MVQRLESDCCFGEASDAVDWMLKNMSCRTRDQATRIGEKLVDEGFLEHVCEPQPFQDAYLFFRFTVRSGFPNATIGLF